MSFQHFVCIIFCASCLLLPNISFAQDVRVALLVGNQHGWQKDPKLRYALKGDLLPFAQVLKRLGFETITLQNRSPKQLRQALQKLYQRSQRGEITTFLFYYTGHSDRHALHMGPKHSGKPFQYQELVAFFKKLQVERRFLFLDSCFSGEIIRKFGSLKRYKQLVSKGARIRKWVNLGAHIPGKSDQHSFQVLSSGLAVTWESQRYRASIFTHHMLQGLRGQADRDRDGKISFHELFNYISDAMHKDIQEKPQMFGVVRRSQSYPLAPAYSSTLRIGAKLQGQLQVSIANFYWSWRKQQGRPVRLSLVHGKGLVQLKRGTRCWHQQIELPKGGTVSLKSQWQPTRCRYFSNRPKGAIQLQTKVALPRYDWSIHLNAGLQQSILGSTLLPGGGIGLRHRYFGFFLDLWGSQDAISSYLQIELQAELGYRLQLQRFDLFLGGFLGGSLLFQDLSRQVRTGPLFQVGAVVSPSFWLTTHWGLSARLRAGVVFGSFGGKLQPMFAWSASLGSTWRW